ncbi:MAG: cell wall metabolism sensor histidine kinase WalK, partial [Spirochaetales bacterium]|nr:cell wall metabolism sensor histidine kinase WalK [Spirochaetales bacterium]
MNQGVCGAEDGREPNLQNPQISLATMPEAEGISWASAIFTLLTKSSVSDEVFEKFRRHSVWSQDPKFLDLLAFIKDLRELSFALSRGNLQKFVASRGFILSNLKALQSNLRHLTWQAQRVADGDFSQKVDYLGEFSASFNEMTEKLKEAKAQLTAIASVDTLTQVP